MSMNTKQLRYVAVLAEYKNFTRAADELGISQPSLSQYIKKIEKQLGTSLFIRVGQDVRLTEAGKAYLDLGRQILNLENEMNCKIADLANDVCGEIIIGIAPYRCTSIMPEVINEFHRSFPKIKVVLKEQLTCDLKENAERGRLDLGISTLPLDDSIFDYHTVMHEKTVFAIPKKMVDKVLPNYETVSIKEYAGLPLISIGETQIMGKLLINLCKSVNITPNIVVECIDQVAVHSMVISEVGAALLPLSLVQGHENNEVMYLFLEEHIENREIVVFYRKNSYLSRPMAKMVEILTEQGNS